MTGPGTATDLVMGGGVWALGKSGGQLALPPLFNLAPGSGEPVDFNQAAWLDIDGDGAADLVTAGAGGAPTAFGLKSGPNGRVLTFPFSYPAQIVGAGIGIEAVDLNGDGYPDLIVTAAGSVTDTYLSLGSASGVKAPVALQWPAGAYVSAIGQFGGDSTLDFMVLGYTQGTGAALQFYILNQELAVTATQTATLATVSTFPNYVYAVDFDGDGLSDLILGYVNPISAELWKNQGNYTFSKVLTLSPQTQAYSGEWDYFALFAGNFYGNGRQDLWFTELPNGAASLYENLGGGALGPVSDTLVLQAPFAVDLKGNGVLDMVDSNAIYMGPFTPGPRVTLDVAVSIAGPLANFDDSGVLAYPVLHSIQDYRGYAGFLRPGPTPLP